MQKSTFDDVEYIEDLTRVVISYEIYIEDLTRVVISYEIYETRLWRVS